MTENLAEQTIICHCVGITEAEIKARIQKNNKAINEFGEAVFMLED